LRHLLSARYYKVVISKKIVYAFEYYIWTKTKRRERKKQKEVVKIKRQRKKANIKKQNDL